MPDSPARTIRSGWPILAAAGACALALGTIVAATGGVDWVVGPLHARVHQPWRLLAAGLLLLAAAAWLGGARCRAALERAWDARERGAGPIAGAAAVAAAAVGLVKGTWVAGSADSYGYVSQALLWLEGLPVRMDPLAAVVPWQHAEWSLSPLGYRPGIGPGLIVPTYPPGLPLTMAAFAGIGGADAAFVVVPLLGAGAVWLTFLLGRRWADGATGAAAAALLAASPIFLYQVVQPMSDVPVTAWWLLALWGAAAGRPLAAGAGAGLAVMTRPNLVAVAAVVMAAVLVHEYSRTRATALAARSAVRFALPLAAAMAFLAWLNGALYGSPFVSGYGAASELFSSRHVGTNTARYARWLLDTHTPVVLAGLAAPLVARFAARDVSRPLRSGPAWLGIAFVATVAASYLPYSPFEEWWYLRFLLPAIPVLLILAAAVALTLVRAAPAAWRLPAVAAGVVLLASHYVATAGARDAFALRALESRYAAAGAFAASRLPGNAILLSVQESGPLRMYGRRATVRFDHIEPGDLDAAVQFLDGAGYRAYFVLEAWENTQFRDRFSRTSALGLLDWPPAAEVGRPVKVRFYDPRDRPRFLAGEPVATWREPNEARGRR